MVRPYFENHQVTSDGSAVLTVNLDPIDKNERAEIRSLAGKHDNIATTEGVEFYVVRGGTEYSLGIKTPGVANYKVGWKGCIWLTEGDYIGARYPAAANGEIMYLDAIGQLYRVGN